jgi:hypothetical protein
MTEGGRVAQRSGVACAALHSNTDAARTRVVSAAPQGWVGEPPGNGGGRAVGPRVPQPHRPALAQDAGEAEDFITASARRLSSSSGTSSTWVAMVQT